MMEVLGVAIILALSLGNAAALAPIIVIVILIAAAAGLTRGGDFFSFLGIGTLLGLSRGVGGSGAGKGLKAGSAMQRRSLKAMMVKRTPKSAKGAVKKKGQARKARKLQKKQAKLIAKAGAAAGRGNEAKAQAYLSKAAKVGAKATKFGGKPEGLVNQAVKMQKSKFRLPSTKQNLKTGISYLSEQGKTMTGANLGRASASAVAAGSAGGLVAGLAAHRDLKRATIQHANMGSLVSTFKNPLPQPKTTGERLGAWKSQAFSSQNIMQKAAFWIPGVGVGAALYQGSQAAKPALSTSYAMARSSSNPQAAAQVHQQAMGILEARNAQNAVQPYHTMTQVRQYTVKQIQGFAQQSYSNSTVALTQIQTQNANAANVYNKAQNTQYEGQLKLNYANAAAQNAAQNAAALQDLVGGSSLFRAPPGTAPDKEQALRDMVASAQSSLVGIQASINAANNLSKEVQEAQKEVTHASGLVGQAQSVIQLNTNNASTVQAEIAEKVRDLSRETSRSVQLTQDLATLQTGLAQAMAAMNAPGLGAAAKDVLARQIYGEDVKDAQGNVSHKQGMKDDVDQKIQAKIQAKIETDAKVTSLEKDINDLNTQVADAQNKARDAQTTLQDAQNQLQSAGTKLNDVAMAAQAVADKAITKTASAYSELVQALRDAGGNVPGPLVAITPERAPERPEEVKPINSAIAPEPAFAPLPSPMPEFGIPAPPPGAGRGLQRDYTTLIERSDAVQRMQQQADAYRAQAADPSSSPEQQQEAQRKADNLDVLAAYRQQTLFDAETMYKLNEAVDQAKKEGKENLGISYNYQVWSTVQSNRLNYDKKLTEAKKDEYGNAWSEAAAQAETAGQMKKAEKEQKEKEQKEKERQEEEIKKQ